MKKKAYVVGNNVSTSLSPLIFKFWFEKHNIDGVYGYIEVEETSFNKKIKEILGEEGLVGLNITIPFKEQIINVLRKQDSQEGAISQSAKKINAVNCIYKSKKTGTWIGENTDGHGFLMAIKPFEKKILGETAIVVGYGGASKAIISALYSKFKNIKLFNRSFEKIKNIQTQNNKIKTFKLEDLHKHTFGADLIINTTPTNVLKNKSDLKIQNTTIGFDVVYRPRQGTGFLKAFSEEKRIEGIRMLAYQAAPCFERWFGVMPEIDKELMSTLYEEMESA